MTRNRITETPSFLTKIIGPIETLAVIDGGKWALYCDHFENGEWLNAGMIQDTNRRRLAAWANVKRGEGFTEWCPVCQEACAEIS